jgi:osmotically-inducible protein OsmY
MSPSRPSGSVWVMDQQPAHIDDIDLAAALAAALERSGSLPSILVAVSDGVVTLEGAAESERQREQAEAVVRRFRGVAGVFNNVALG